MYILVRYIVHIALLLSDGDTYYLVLFRNENQQILNECMYRSSTHNT